MTEIYRSPEQYLALLLFDACRWERGLPRPGASVAAPKRPPLAYQRLTVPALLGAPWADCGGV